MFWRCGVVEMRVGLNVWNMLNTRQACRFLFIKTARICSNLLRANGQYVRYPSKENRKSSIVLWEMGRIVGNHMQQVNLLIPHKDIFESSVLFFTQALLDWMFPLSRLLKTKIAPKQVVYSGCGAVMHMWLFYFSFNSWGIEMLEILNGHLKADSNSFDHTWLWYQIIV